MKDVRTLQVIPCELVKPFKSNFPLRLAQSRAELLEKLLTELGAENSGFTLDNVMTVKERLKHAKYIYQDLLAQKHKLIMLSCLETSTCL